ncbi:hypothetical protein [Natronorubrum thiooxidans]|uniref:DUF8159 domain-containing protein n=1 Tax=Natronorubrum thiooxidans TaxID=308853 RepID=A0A1N7GLT8_9EURY|nr:hypothetical protein [Natronorubrum thiooxidans]SIS13509.1 hypothetical protein SAMN05421752_11356 [Natronorubrum thiooxidans]
MEQRSASELANGISRRTVLATATAIGGGTLAGCISDSGDGASDDTHSDDGDHDHDENSETDEDSELATELAAEMVDAIDDELSVSGWELNGMFVPDYTDSGGPEADIEILGPAYADIVDQGFDRRAMPTARDDDGSVDFMVFLEPEWAREYLDGNWTKAEYYAEIADSEH